jgi:small ligand-binding sensory domain FIST
MPATELPSFASALSTDADPGRAEEQAIEGLRTGLQGGEPDLVCAFVSHHYGEAIERLGPRVAAALGASNLLGCTGEGIIGAAREIEREPALSLWGACLPETIVRPFQVEARLGGSGEASEGELVFSGMPRVKARSKASLLLLADPFSFPMDEYLKRLNTELPGVPAVGGMASGGMGPGQNLLFTQSGLVEGGAIGVVLEGGVEVRAVVSPGCRPIGKPWVVTECEENLALKLGGRPAMEVLMETLMALPATDQQHFQKRPFVGLAIDPAKHEFRPGDFLARQVVGLQTKKQAVAVGDHLRRGQTVQFLIQDAGTASSDLTALMGAQGGGAVMSSGSAPSAGALLFSCNGRGSRMFDEPDHDVTRVRKGLAADVPVSGFFAMGEIGPVGGKNFLHGFTASVAVFRRRGG